MAHMTKYTHPLVGPILAHNARVGAGVADATHIDPTRTPLNFCLHPDRGMSDYEYYAHRKSQLYCYGRSDVKTLIGWVCTLPRGVPSDQEREFFTTVYQFFCNRYGEENIIQSIVHMDEEGQPHLHVCLIPAVPDPKHGGMKVCANSVATRCDLITFHPDLQRWLDERGIRACVNNGISAVIGRNLRVDEIKRGALDLLLGVSIDVEPGDAQSDTIDWQVEFEAIVSTAQSDSAIEFSMEEELEIDF